MIWKVCGMREATNIQEVAALVPDFMGFIFYEKSPRNVASILSSEIVQHIPPTIRKIGVFVNASIAYIEKQVTDFQLNGVQLHGNESAEQCAYFLAQNLVVIKAFSVDETFDFSVTDAYQSKVSYLLFDTKAPKGFGGHGISFDWNLLKNYTSSTPFLLAGGISLENIEDIKALTHSQLVGIDVNSRFELSPARKDISKLSTLKKAIGL